MKNNSLNIVQVVRLTGSNVVCKENTYLIEVILVSDGGGVGDALLYNGQTTGGDKAIDLSVLQGSTLHLSFNRPIPFINGMYLAIGSNVTSCTLVIASVED